MKSSVLYTKLSFLHDNLHLKQSISSLNTVSLRRHSDDSFSEDSYKAVWTFLFHATGSSPRARPGVSSRMRTCPALRPVLQLCPCEGAEVATAAQVQDARPLAQRQCVGGELHLRLPAEGGLRWSNLWNCNGLQTLMKMTCQEIIGGKNGQTRILKW